MKKSVYDIKQLLENAQNHMDPLFKEYEQDERKGVQKLIKQKLNYFAEQEKLKRQFLEMTNYEREQYSKGVKLVAGVDEVGRGPLAGPVVAAAVVLPTEAYLPGVNDSKKLSEQRREEYYELIQEKAVSIGIGVVSAETIDRINIYKATKQAMVEAVLNLSVEPEHLLIDAMTLHLPIPQQSIIKGDTLSISIAASSIVAKVTRDRMMKQLGELYPQYGFEKHMGYGTKQHIEAIKQYGAVQEHRKTFAPIKDMIKEHENS